MRVSTTWNAKGVRSTWISLATSFALTFAAWMGAASLAQAAPPDTMPIWRLQVRFITSGVDDAGTDDAVKIELNGTNRTWLDSGRDDHEGNSDETFDLRLEGINTLADIDFFRLEKVGDDGWAIRQMQLIVNNVPIYIENSGPTWIDSDDGWSNVFLNDDFFLRQRSQWINYVVPARQNPVPVFAMQRRVEALVGDWVHSASGTNFIGGENGAELATMATNAWRVDLDLEDEKQWPFPDLEFDVDFDLTVTCVNNRPKFTVTNVNTDASWPEDDGGSSSFAANQLGPRLTEMIKNYNFVPCPTIILASNGDLHFNRKFPPFEIAEWELIDELAPFSLHVSTGGETKPGGTTTLQAAVKSTLKEDQKVQFSFDLPAQVALAGSAVQVQVGEKSYRIGVKSVQRKDGSSSVVFSDALISGVVARYNLPIVYKAGKDVTDEIKTVIQPLDAKIAASVTPVEASTWFEFHSDLVVPIVTSVAQSEYTDGTTVERTK